MKQSWDYIYSLLVADISRCKTMLLSEAATTESCFQIACKYWERVKTLWLDNPAHTDKEEIIFFREVKPRFTAHIEYYMLLNLGLLLVPEKPIDRLSYWKEEARRYKLFYERNSEFIKYYHGKYRYQDRKYFLQRNSPVEWVPQEGIYNDYNCRTAHDQIVRSYLANRMYNDYIIELLSTLEFVGG